MGGISWLQKSSPGGLRGPSPRPGSPACSISARKRSPHDIWLWKSVGILSDSVRQKTPGYLDVHLKGLFTDSLAYRHSPWAPAEGQQLKSSKDIQGEIEWCGFGARAWGTATIVSVLSLPPTQPADRHHLSCVEPSHRACRSRWAANLNLLNLMNTIHPNLMTPWDPAPPKQTACLHSLYSLS